MPAASRIVDATSIRERPPEAEDRAIPGHWEGDLLSGANNSYIATLVERHSRFAMLIKVPSKDTEVVVAALRRHVRKLPATLRRLPAVGRSAAAFLAGLFRNGRIDRFFAVGLLLGIQLEMLVGTDIVNIDTQRTLVFMPETLPGAKHSTGEFPPVFFALLVTLNKIGRVAVVRGDAGDFVEVRKPLNFHICLCRKRH